jgi:Tol biopolymer transport system component
MKKITIIYISMLLSLSACWSNRHNVSSAGINDGFGAFSFKKGNIAFTYFKNNIASIYYTTNLDSVAKRLTFPEKGWDQIKELSNDLSKILYFNYPNSNFKTCNIFLYDLKKNKVDTLLKNHDLITDACLSNDNKSIYFIHASEFKNYSPLVSAAPHGMDIFELEITTKKVRKLTSLSAYAIQSLVSSYSDSIICANITGRNGLVLFSTKTGYFKELYFNSPRNDVKDWFMPVSIRHDSILYEAPYELYKHNLVTNKSQFILRCPDGNHFGIIQPDENWENILFSSGPKNYLYNLPNSRLIEIKLKL